MRAYVCDWCKRLKKQNEEWILGFAAERTGATGVQREISIAAAWSDVAAAHPLAVHFCCAAHQERYITALFKSPPAASRARKARVVTGVSRRASRGGEVICAPEGVRLQAGGRILAAANVRGSKTTDPVRRNAPADFSDTDAIRCHGLSVRL